MSNFAQDIEAEAGAPIEAVVIGEHGWGGTSDEPARPRPARRGVVLTWDEARSMLDYEYSTGYGAPECDAIRVWTASKVLWVTQYDGATRLSSALRNPVDHVPDMPGG